MNAGENNGRSRLTERRAQILREYYLLHKRPPGAPQHDSWVTPYEIARRLHMATSSIQAMLKGQTWITVVDQSIPYHQRLNRGEYNAKAKLTEADVRCIRSDPRQNIVIASEYGVSHSTIAHIKLRLSWRHVI